MTSGPRRSFGWATAVRVLIACCALAALPACGGDGDDGGGTVPEAAELAPADTALFLSVDTDLQGEQWRQAEALLDKFPDGDELLDTIESELDAEDLDLERDVRPAVGPELGVAAFELRADEPSVVLYTQPRDRAKFDALLEKLEQADPEDEAVTREVDDWVLVADDQADIDRFVEARGRGTLGDEEEFRNAVEATDEDALVFAYVGGGALREAFAESVEEEGAPRELTDRLREIGSFASSASATDDGLRFDALYTYDGDAGLDSYAPALDEALPAKPLAYVSFANLDEPARDALDAARDAIPGFAQQLTQVEDALQLSLEDDVIALLDGESALAVYPSSNGDLPVVVDYVLEVDDEQEARRLIERLGALLELSESGSVEQVTVAGLQATRMDFSEAGFSLYWAVFDGKLAVSTEGESGLGALRADTPRLADDAAYSAALDAAEAPDDVAALVYSDVETAVPFFLELAEEEGEEVDAKARRNLEPLRSLVMYTGEDDAGLRLSGFLAIE